MKKVMLAGKQVTFRTKISNSKKQLAKIISENGGWREGANFSAQDQDGEVFFYEAKPTRFDRLWLHHGVLGGDWINCGKAQPNWHQTILSRDEYLHLYPAPDAELAAMCSGVTEENKHPEYCESVIRPIPEPSGKPAIEQLAAEHRNRKDYAERKQQEANEAKAEADAKLAELVAAGKAVGLVLGVAAPAPAPEPERPFRVGDAVRLIRRRGGDAKLGEVGTVVRVDSATDLVVNFPSQSRYLVEDTDVELASKGTNNA